MSRVAIAAAPALFVLLWSTGFIGARFGLPYIEPLTFLAVRMIFVVLIMALIAFIARARRPDATEIGHSLVAGSLVHGAYLGGVFVAISQGVPAGISALIPGLQPILTSTIASRWMGETVTRTQWLGLVLGLAGVALVLHNREIVAAGSLIGWLASFLSLLGITLGTLYQKRYCASMDLRTGSVVQFAASLVVFATLALVFETRVVEWTPSFAFALGWLVLVLSLGAISLLLVLIRRGAAAKVASLFYLVPPVTAVLGYLIFGERLGGAELVGMAITVVGVYLVIRS